MDSIENEKSFTQHLEIPDLSDLSVNSIRFFMHHFFNATTPKDDKQYALILNFIRLVDLAVQEYQYGRASAFKFWNTHNSIEINAITLAAGHFESCVTSIKRSIDILNAIKGKRVFLKADINSFLPKKLYTFKTAEREITKMRDAIQHLDRDIVKGNIKQGQPMLINFNEDRFELGDNYILYNDLTTWLREMHGYASGFCKYYSPSRDS